ncbi:unnamed protein product [Symbiodinium microadriaticum]|nr:unnamed protein product [Symbiodinium microadriaticum]
MEAPTDRTDRDGCPVLRAWAGTPCIMQRLLKSRILAVNHATLGRAALSDNVEVLAPLINHLGLRPSVHIIKEFLIRFYSNYLPKNVKMASGASSGSTRADPSDPGDSGDDDDDGCSASDDESASEAEESEACESDPEVDPVPLPTPATDASPGEVPATDPANSSAPEPPNPMLVIQKSEEVPTTDPANSTAPNPKQVIQESKEVPTADSANSKAPPVPVPSKGLTLEPVASEVSVDEATAQQLMLDELRELEQEGPDNFETQPFEWEFVGLDEPLHGAAEQEVDLSDFELRPCKLDFGAAAEAAHAEDSNPKHPDAELVSASPKTLNDDDNDDDVSCAASHHTLHYEGEQEPCKREPELDDAPAAVS